MFKKSSCRKEDFSRILLLPRTLSSWGSDNALADGGWEVPQEKKQGRREVRLFHDWISSHVF